MDVHEIVESLLEDDDSGPPVPETPSFASALQDLLAHIKTVKLANNRRMGLTYPGVDDFVVGTDEGPKWIRIWVKDGPGRSAYGFVDKPTGHLWKCAGWKGPEKNFARGSLYDRGTWSCAGPYSLG